MAKKYLLYIHPKQFENEKEKSKLVNDLLTQHYDQANQLKQYHIGLSIVVPKQAALKNFPGIPDGTKVSLIEKPLDKTDYHPTPDVWTLPEAQNSYELCKHSAVKGMCKKGCK